MPDIFLIGGPNGAGKTTAAMRLVPGFLGLREFVNADGIAAGISPFNRQAVAMQAGRLMLQRLAGLAQARADFAFETTLAPKTFVPLLRGWQSAGHAVHLVYLWLPTAELAIKRVAQRERAGGHGLPPEIIRRRFLSGWRNFLDLYLPLANRWRAYDNSGHEPMLVARGGRAELTVVVAPEIWTTIARGAL